VDVTGALKNCTKNLYNEIIRKHKMTDPEIFSFINARKIDAVYELRNQLIDFLNN